MNIVDCISYFNLFLFFYSLNCLINLFKLSSVIFRLTYSHFLSSWSFYSIKVRPKLVFFILINIKRLLFDIMINYFLFYNILRSLGFVPSSLYGSLVLVTCFSNAILLIFYLELFINWFYLFFI
jgi:hypothetical protein